MSFKERTDVTAVPAMGVVAETMAALVMASEAMRKFGGDSVAELVRNRDGYLASLGERRRRPRRPAVAERLPPRGDDGRGQVHGAGWRRTASGGTRMDVDDEVDRITRLPP